VCVLKRKELAVSFDSRVVRLMPARAEMNPSAVEIRNC
jgi:hypothetical protein